MQDEEMVTPVSDEPEVSEETSETSTEETA